MEFYVLCPHNKLSNDIIICIRALGQSVFVKCLKSEPSPNKTDYSI